jgi:uncharacterized protein DUF4340
LTENHKTSAFVVAGAALVLAAWASRPVPPPRGSVNDAGQPFFPDFKDPVAAASLEIIEFDADSGTPQAFKVARNNGVWSIPSHENYPADAEKQFGRAAAEFINLTKGNSVSDKPSEHELFAAVDPAQVGPGAAGVGTRVTLAGDDGRELATLIIGKEVRDSKGLRYVRVPGQDRVYLCKIDAGKFSTKFEDWIEKDLLKLDASELGDVYINDYAIDEFNQKLTQGDVLKLAYDSKKYNWQLEGLAEGEKLVPGKLNDLRQALDDLKIADVHRKPGGLSSELKATDSLRLDPEAVRSLQSRGFYIFQGQLISNQGETIVRAKDGVQYTLRFGEIAQMRNPGAAEAEGAVNPQSSSSDQGRYLFVTAEFNGELIPKPDLEVMPDLGALGIEVPEDEPEEAQEDEDAADQAASGETAEPQAAKPSIKQAMEMAQQKIDQDNQQKQDEYAKKVEAGRKRARELNDRFADWYYVISDSTYGKIRLLRSDIVERADAPTPETGS